MESGFAAVWERVTGDLPAKDEQAKLRRWIEDEAHSIRAYEALLRTGLPRAAQETLRQILSEKRIRLKRLQTVVFLRTGDIHVVSLPEEPKPPTLLRSLRSRYAAELAQAESFRRAVSGGSDLREICAELAEGNRLTAERLRSLAERLL
jgi:hypothetical protein